MTFTCGDLSEMHTSFVGRMCELILKHLYRMFSHSLIQTFLGKRFYSSEMWVILSNEQRLLSFKFYFFSLSHIHAEMRRKAVAEIHRNIFVARPFWLDFLHFYAVFRKIWLNNRLVRPLRDFSLNQESSAVKIQSWTHDVKNRLHNFALTRINRLRISWVMIRITTVYW